jgi:hypothetical protein
MNLVKLELRVRDWYVPHPLFMSLQIGYLKLEEIFKSQRKISLIIHYQPQTWPPQTILVSDWLISNKSSPLKPLSQMIRNLVGIIYGQSSIKIAHFVPIH